MNITDYNKMEMDFLLKQIQHTKDMIEVFEEDPERYANELENYRQILKGLLAELEWRKNSKK